MFIYYIKYIYKQMDKDDIIKQLYKRQPKEIPPNHKEIYKANFEHQIDILYVPQDKTYKYILTIIDVNNSLCDARGLTNQTTKQIIDKLEDIYNKSKYLKYPFKIQADNQFDNNLFKEWCEKHNILLSISEPYRSRQQSYVERLNQTIGERIFKKQLEKEIETNKTSKEWVKYLPVIIKELNERRLNYVDEDLNNINKQKEKEPKIKENDYYIPINSIVRIKLDKPFDFVEEKPLPGNFRAVDIKWSKDLYKVIDSFIVPNNPMLYKVIKITNPEIIYKDELTKPLKYDKQPLKALFNINSLQLIKYPLE